MKIRIEVDCTPEEARGFLGLPDVRALNEAMMQEMQVKLAQSMSMMDPEMVMQKWLPAGMQGVESFTKLMWEAAQQAWDPKRNPPKGDA